MSSRSATSTIRGLGDRVAQHGRHEQPPSDAGLVAPRALLLVSATEDRHSADADAIEQAIAGRFPAGALRNARFDGGHALTPERFATVVDWLAEASATCRT